MKQDSRQVKGKEPYSLDKQAKTNHYWLQSLRVHTQRPLCIAGVFEASTRPLEEQFIPYRQLVHVLRHAPLFIDLHRCIVFQLAHRITVLM